MQKIFLDNNATTPLDPEVLQAMLLDLGGSPLNPSSVHSFGRHGKELLFKAKDVLASFFSAKPEEIIFTSGGTESIALMLHSLPKRGHLITTAIEHSSLYKTVGQLEQEVTYLPVGKWGAPTLSQVEEAIRSDTSAVILGAANTETGVKIPLQEIALLCEKKGIFLLIDAVAWIGKAPFICYPGISAAALSGHKFHGPKGVGALFARKSFKIKPLFLGGSQEHGRRAGTENLSGILGQAKALELFRKKEKEIEQALLSKRTFLERGLQSQLPDLLIHGEGPRISNVSNIAFLGVDGETLLIELDLQGVLLSHGSACSSGALEPSRALTQMGISPKIARSSLRLSVSRMNTQEELEKAIDIITTVVLGFRQNR